MIRAVQVSGQVTVVARRQAQEPIAAGGFPRLAQQQVDLLVVGAVAVIEVAALVEPQQLVQRLVIGRTVQAVGLQAAIGADPGDTEQVRLLLAQLGDDVRQLLRARRRAVLLDLIERHLGLERHVQAHVIGELGTVVQALLILVSLGMTELGNQLPQQQAEQQQDQQGQRAFQ
ncbi:hypothetical protein D9M71_323250 [compost metagenome]